MPLRTQTCFFLLCLVVGCGPAWSGKVSGYSLDVKDAVFTSVNVDGESVGAVLILSDQPNLCAQLSGARPPPNASLVVFSLSRSADGRRLAPDVGDYVVAAEPSLSGATSTGVFIRTDSNGTNSIPAANAKASSGLLKVTEYAPTGRETMTAQFDGRFGSQGDSVTGVVTAKWCGVPTEAIAQGFLGALPGISAGGRCSRVSRCSGDPKPTPDQIKTCLETEKSPPACSAESVAFTDCYWAHQQCGSDNRTDSSAAAASCGVQLSAFTRCLTPPSSVHTQNFSGSVVSGESSTLMPFAVKPGSSFSVHLSGSGDADLYVGFGSVPTSGSSSCQSTTSGSTEHCQLTVPPEKTVAYVTIRGYMASTYSAAVTWTGP